MYSLKKTTNKTSQKVKNKNKNQTSEKLDCIFQSKNKLLQKYVNLKNQSAERIREIDEVTLEIEALKKVFEINEKALISCESANIILKDKCHELQILNDIYVAEIVKLKGAE